MKWSLTAGDQILASRLVYRQDSSFLFDQPVSGQTVSHPESWTVTCCPDGVCYDWMKRFGGKEGTSAVAVHDEERGSLIL